MDDGFYALVWNCTWDLVLGYPTSVVEGVGDEFISVRESLIS